MLISNLTEEAGTSTLVQFSFVTANYPQKLIREIILFYAFEQLMLESMPAAKLQGASKRRHKLRSEIGSKPMRQQTLHWRWSGSGNGTLT
jgi:hypothetical protein